MFVCLHINSTVTHLTGTKETDVVFSKSFINVCSEFEPFRIQALLQWVHDSSRVAAHKMSGSVGYIGSSACSSSASSREYGLLMPSPSHLHCVAAILWHSYELPVDYDLHALLSRDLFELVLVLSTTVKHIYTCNFMSVCTTVAEMRSLPSNRQVGYIYI